jgi:hypothetical protein
MWQNSLLSAVETTSSHIEKTSSPIEK